MGCHIDNLPSSDICVATISQDHVATFCLGIPQYYCLCVLIILLLFFVYHSGMLDKQDLSYEIMDYEMLLILYNDLKANYQIFVCKHIAIHFCE